MPEYAMIWVFHSLKNLVKNIMLIKISRTSCSQILYRNILHTTWQMSIFLTKAINTEQFKVHQLNYVLTNKFSEMDDLKPTQLPKQSQNWLSPNNSQCNFHCKVDRHSECPSMLWSTWFIMGGISLCSIRFSRKNKSYLVSHWSFNLVPIPRGEQQSKCPKDLQALRCS